MTGATEEMSRPIALTCKGITARYSRITVVAGVDLEVRQGEMLAVLGANGAGKSSMLGSIAGIVNGSGEIIVGSKSIDRMGAPARAANGIAFVPERRGNIFPTMSVAENIEVGLRLLPPSERDEQRNFILGLFPILKQRTDASAGVLSGGEQQMLAIAMALGRKPEVLMLDEPSQGLAPAVFDILEHAFDVLRKRGLALLLAEQNVPFASRTADRYIILSYGEIVQSGDKSELENPEQIANAFMGTAN